MGNGDKNEQEGLMVGSDQKVRVIQVWRFRVVVQGEVPRDQGA
jgi:hypothetical protein